MADTTPHRRILLPKIAPHLFPRAAGFKRPRRANRVNHSIPTPRPNRLNTFGAYRPTSPLAPVEVREPLIAAADDLHTRLLSLQARVRVLDAEIKDAEADKRRLEEAVEALIEDAGAGASGSVKVLKGAESPSGSMESDPHLDSLSTCSSPSAMRKYSESSSDSELNSDSDSSLFEDNAGSKNSAPSSPASPGSFDSEYPSNLLQAVLSPPSRKTFRVTAGAALAAMWQSPSDRLMKSVFRESCFLPYTFVE
ncbi:hypothetical protein B0H16DRAFT_1736228 [Mycena metata]|uniref:Uncharacterized protein n=1 Tax=Mycena metata TaxID=1033252 RepID=A0AAD7MPL3_9AGAR|nr:hypothetical protein B0H16DRAFT_1736228 [Mycena metata]